MSGAISAISVAGATAAAGSTGFGATLAAAGGALAANAGAIGTIGSLGSGAIGGLGAIQSSSAASAAAGYNAQVAANNAKIATTNANYAGAQGEENVAASGARTKATVGATLANEGASGVDVNTGSDVNVRESESKLGMLDALNVRSQAAQAAYGYQVGAAADTGQQSLYKSQQESDQIGGYLNAGSTVLGGVGNAAKYSTWLSTSGPLGNLTGDYGGYSSPAAEANASGSY